MVVDQRQDTANGRTDDIGGRSAGIQSRQVGAAIFGGDNIGDNPAIKGRECAYAWTIIIEPANKPVNDLQIIRGHMLFDMAWKREPTASEGMERQTEAGTEQRKQQERPTTVAIASGTHEHQT